MCACACVYALCMCMYSTKDGKQTENRRVFEGSDLGVPESLRTLRSNCSRACTQAARIHTCTRATCTCIFTHLRKHTLIHAFMRTHTCTNMHAHILKYIHMDTHSNNNNNHNNKSHGKHEIYQLASHLTCSIRYVTMSFLPNSAAQAKGDFVA